MRLHRPALAGLVLGFAVLPVTAASAAAGVTAAGSAVSSATLATVSIGALDGVVEAQNVSLGSLTATAQTLTSAAPAVTFVPVTLNGVKTGAVTVTPANSPQTVGAVSTADLGVLSATSPGATLTASDSAGPSSSLTSSLGSVKVLGLPVTLDGGVDVGSVTDASHAQAGKALTISDVSLPNLSDLLAALGIDIAALPVGTLNALVNDLSIALSGAQQTAFDNANAAVDAASLAAEGAVDDVATATTDLAAKAAALDSALSGATYPLGVDPQTSATWDDLDGATQTAIIALNPAVGTAATAFATAQSTLATAQTALAPLQAALDTAIDTLAGVVDGVLAGIPLVEVGAADIATKAAVGATKTATVTGAISGVKVLGTDILESVTGDTELDVAALVGDVADDVNAALNTVSVALSNALSGVTGATGLVVPAPEIELMKKTTATGTDGAFGTASATLSALSISLGSVTVPELYALPDAASLPGIGAITDGFQTAPLGVTVGTLVESARYRGATTTTPTTPTTPTLPSTGGPEGLAIVAVIGTALAVGIRRLRTQH